jgi:hypothetical protein
MTPETISKIASRIAERINDEEKARLQRAVEGLTSGQMTVVAGPDGWRVLNGQGKAYEVRNSDGWSCTCPDFTHRNVRCKHIFAAYLAQCAGLVQPASPNGHEPSEPEEASGAQPQPQPQPAQADQAAPTGEGLDPVDPVVPFGRHRGKRLSQILAETPDDLMWIVRKMEARSEADLALKEAAARLIEQAARERAEAILRGEAEMPTLPFGEEKGKPLDKAHPKWVSILSRKTVQDAFTFADAVLYETARRLQQRRLQERRKKASSLDAEVFLRAVQEVTRETAKEAVREAVLAALEAVREREADQEAVLTDLADLRRRVERLEKAVSALRHVAEREALLEAR